MATIEIPDSLPGDPVVLTDPVNIGCSPTAGTIVSVTGNHASTHYEGGDDPVNHDDLLNGHNLTTDIDHDQLDNTHNLTTDIDHNQLTNSHNLNTDIDHDALTNFVSAEHVNHSTVLLTLVETSGETSVSDSGTGKSISASRSWTIGIADNPTIPGDEYMLIPTGTTAQRPGAPSPGMVRYNTQTSQFEGNIGGSWYNLVYAGGAFHDGFSDFVAAEHIDWTNTSSVLDTSGSIKTDVISEHTGGSGVTIDGVQMKDDDIIFQAGAFILAENNATAPLYIGAYATGTGTPTALMTLTSNPTPTLDLAASTTIGGSAIIDWTGATQDFYTSGNVGVGGELLLDANSNLSPVDSVGATIHIGAYDTDTSTITPFIDIVSGSTPSMTISGDFTISGDPTFTGLSTGGVLLLDSGWAIITGSSATTPQDIVSSSRITNAEYEKTGRVFRWTVFGTTSAALDFHIKLGSTTFFNGTCVTSAGSFRSIIEFGAVDGTNSDVACTTIMVGSGNALGVHSTGLAHGTGATLVCQIDATAAATWSVYMSTLEVLN